LLDLVLLAHKTSLDKGLYIVLQVRLIVGFAHKSEGAVHTRMARPLAIMTFLHDFPP